jgi:trimeric autotransporter adhesin
MTKARTLADFISDGSPLADGTISVSEVSGAAPLANPTFTGNVDLGDNVQIRLGDDNDLRIYHDASTGNSYIWEQGTGGELWVLGTDIRFANTNFTSNYARFVDGGEVELFHGNQVKLETAADGVDITGDVGATTATIAGTVTATSVSLNALLPTNAFATLVLNNAVGIANDPVAIDTWLETTASDGYKYGDMDKNGSIGSSDGSQIVQIAGGVASEAVTSRWYDIVVPSLVQQSWYADLVADGTLTGGGAFSGPLTGNVTGELDLKAIAETISDTAVDVFVYDTSKDSDGGAWRKRTQGTSWYNETLNTATRGSRKEFPAVAVIVYDSSTKDVTIYDADDPNLPMWMVFQDGGGEMLYAGGTPSSVTALNGEIVLGQSGVGALCHFNFIKDYGYLRVNSSSEYNGSNIARRNNNFSSDTVTGTTGAIVNRSINDVAMTVLPNAPIDAATGLPVPTIAVATDGGVSVIKDDGTVVDITFSSFGLCSYVSFIDEQKVSFTTDDTSANQRFLKVYAIPSSDISEGVGYDDNTALESYDIRSAGTGVDLTLFKSAALGGTAQGRGIVGRKVASTSGVGLIDPNSEQPSSGMVSLITSSYNTGWMNGDIKLATLSDTDDTDVTGSELVTNGTFDSDTSGWTASALTTSVASGQATLTMTSTYGTFVQGITTVVGKTYTITCDIVSETVSGALYLGAGTTSGGSQLGLSTTSVGSNAFTFTATGTTTYVALYFNGASSQAAVIDNFTARLAEEDRSVNGNGLQVFGTITKSAVSSGADLVAYSGFSASNYLEQPYNSDLDFGTGDFCYMGWFKTSSNGITMFERCASPRSGNGMTVYIDGTGKPLWYKIVSGTPTIVVVPTVAYNNNTWVHFAAIRQNGVVSLYFNGQKDGSASDSTDMTNTSAIFRLGANATGTSGWTGSLALWRISATAPSPEQIAKIYEDEKVLFQENAQATLYGSSDAVTALAYDDTTELLHVGTSAGRSDFQGLRRVNNTTNAVGAAISASNGMIVEE